jgi:hypothetical protein
LLCALDDVDSDTDDDDIDDGDGVDDSTDLSAHKNITSDGIGDKVAKSDSSSNDGGIGDDDA